ncbi:tripartite tricarboxylate transporter TctB family protein [Tateyamaria omphalii]|uniref:tripartite tricarboxylate transporter TctB family protein n=1 Tax=Tateyamaria omphalii TaxID=299262 RepID=UPI001C99BA47|nr:tripartite tricarboxylate transporter TctB family protein [Tateyamaria omphalii]MBY5933905.1 tripartite tricarboxylate transporter TctB family protein [Tateyamaria omphalii]
MKKWFAAALLLLAIGYTVYGLNTLTLVTSSGRPAAGFFPLVIGILLIISSAINFWGDFHEWRAERLSGQRPVHQADPEAEAKADALGVDAHAIDGGPEFGADVAIVFCYLCVFVAIMPTLGAFLAMILFMLAFLTTFNRKHMLSNVVYSIALPGFLYGLFKILLNASLPTGPLGF